MDSATRLAVEKFLDAGNEITYLPDEVVVYSQDVGTATAFSRVRESIKQIKESEVPFNPSVVLGNHEMVS